MFPFRGKVHASPPMPLDPKTVQKSSAGCSTLKRAGSCVQTVPETTAEFFSTERSIESLTRVRNGFIREPFPSVFVDALAAIKKQSLFTNVCVCVAAHFKRKMITQSRGESPR